MKIGLFSPHYAFNYGAVLQAFALKHYLRSKGYDAVILNRRPAYQCAIPSLSGRIARKLEVLTKCNSFGVFEKKYLQPQTRPVVLQEDWKKVDIDEFDAMIVGSDQVWRDNYAFNSFGFNLFFDFLDGHRTKRISYAPSLGKDSWQAAPDTEKKVSDLLCKFSNISVREESSIGILREKFGVEAQLVVDPTLLLSAGDYRDVFSLPAGEGNHIAAYILDYNSELKKTIQNISGMLGLPVKIIAVGSPSSRVGSFMARFSPMPSVIKWLKNIAGSKFVITNSFHGMVFSIIFRKQFVVFMNSERGAARFKSLLSMFGLEDRLVSSDNWKKVIADPIKYSTIEPKIEAWRKKSFEYLANALEK